ncbi:MAG: zinc-binding alcohol dehydrogenase [Caldilineaceae bacterium]|nr:zinc-binding alcohol dehydrogenase [Caldilineaceae bacterium]HRJ41964.1 zinc-binding alcohol dehydrogenase [Caldilineaceae bacterium]
MNARRLISRQVRQIEVESFDPGPIPDDGIFVRNDFSAVSVGTEIWNWVHGVEPGREPSFPRTSGYCNCGTVLAVGRNVTDIQPGQRVAGQGSHASHSILRKPYNRVPEEVPSQHAALLTMAAIALHGIRVAQVQLGEEVAVLGLGLVGQFALALAGLAGAMPLIAIDLDPFRLDKAVERGADVAINPANTEDLPGLVRSLCAGDGADVVLECTGKPGVYPMAVQLVRSAGRLVAVGSPRGSVDFDFLRDVHLREVSILGAFHPATPQQSHIYYPWTKERDRDLILQLMAVGRLPVVDLITHIVQPDECQSVYAMLADNPQDVLGVLFDWRG